ncbi:putative pyridoxal kinase [Microbotryomycetes sp. JL201]|nr:putative pyridoxal kinase [Microbotryomycetes sp. JL201]
MTPTVTLKEKRVLSVQSHVVAGYVGNKSASFPLQLLGWEVDQVNTVEFSYGRWGGSKFDAAHLEDIFSALDANGLLRQSHMLTGYVPGAEALSVVARSVDRLRSINPNLIYVLDPVMGDDGRIYVSESVIPIYKSLMPKATCATPNYFEAELLTDVRILDAASLRLALRTFHDRYRIPNVIISAVSLPRDELVHLGFDLGKLQTDPSARMLVCSGSTIVSDPQDDQLRTVSFGIAFPELAEHYEGVGDVFSALILGRFPDASPSHPVSPLAHVAELAIASLQGILTRTRAHAVALAKHYPDAIIPRDGESAEERVKRLRMVELKLVQSQREILEPVILYQAIAL